MSSTEDNSDGILVTRGLELQWQGPSLYESQQDLDTRDRSGVTPGDGTKPLRLLRQLSPQPINGSVWLCETFDREGKAVRVVLKLFSPTLWAKPDLGYYVANNWTPETLWQRSSGPDLCSTEAFAGIAIPLSYGFYRFTFPPGTLANPVFAHVTEYVQGKNPHGLVWDLAQAEEATDVHMILEAIFEQYRRIHANGVAHQDIACRNILIVWDRQSHAAPRVVIFDFDRVKFGRDDGNIFLTEETTLNRFLIELGAWQSGDIVTSWLEEGRGKTLYRSFGSDLLTPQGLKWRAEELAQGDLWRAKHAESARAWTERYDADCRRISPYDPLHTSDDALQAVLTEAELAATEQELAQQGWDAY